jgi:hypothetical protein
MDAVSTALSDCLKGPPVTLFDALKFPLFTWLPSRKIADHLSTHARLDSLRHSKEVSTISTKGPPRGRDWMIGDTTEPAIFSTSCQESARIPCSECHTKREALSFPKPSQHWLQPQLPSFQISPLRSPTGEILIFSKTFGRLQIGDLRATRSIHTWPRGVAAVYE